MTERPKVLSETPPVPTDLLSDLLGGMHLVGAVLFRAEFREPWSVIAPEAPQLAKMLPMRTEHVIPFHIIASGDCWLALPSHEPVWASEGDVLLLPYGDGHHMGSRCHHFGAHWSIAALAAMERRPVSCSWRSGVDHMHHLRFPAV